jgi:hypothetical protein
MCLGAAPDPMEGSMGASVFTCPNTKLNVQHWVDDDEDVPETEYAGIVCAACTRLPFVNRKTGKLLGSDEARLLRPILASPLR